MKTCKIVIIVCTLVLTMGGTIATRMGVLGDVPDTIATKMGVLGDAPDTIASKMGMMEDGGQVINGGWSSI
jgi:hypothetical protein